MKINKQLFDDVLSGKLKGTFILTNGTTINSNSNKLIYTCGPYQEYRFEDIPYIFDCDGKSISPGGLSIIDFIIDEIDFEMYSYNEKEIQFIEHFINGYHMKEKKNMEINKQLFEDVLSGKLKGTFVLRNGITVNGNKLIRTGGSYQAYAFWGMSYIYDCNGQTPVLGCSIIDFIPDKDMKENELKITIPEGQEIDWQESAKQEKIVFKKIDTKPRSWEEYCKQHNTTVTNRYFIDNGAEVRVSGWHPDIPSDMLKNTLPSKELAEAFRAMMQLMSLRQAWIGDWEPDWHDMSYYKFDIACKQGKKFLVITGLNQNRPLSFPTQKMASDFIDCFKDLLEIAKPLI